MSVISLGDFRKAKAAEPVARKKRKTTGVGVTINLGSNLAMMVSGNTTRFVKIVEKSQA